MCFGGADYSSSIDAVMSGQMAAINALQQMFGEGKKLIGPFVETGQEAMKRLSDIFLGEGKDLTDIPAFQTLMGTLEKYGLRGLDRSAAAKGSLLSGPNLKGIGNWLEDLALTKSVQPYLAGVGGLYSGGLQGGMSLANLAGSMGNSMAGVYTTTGNQLASLYGAQARSQGGGLSDIMGAIGFALPQIFGLSGQLGASALGSLFSGGSGSSSLYSPSLVGVSNAYNPSNYFQGMRKGGPVRRRRPYVVGEAGPEIFVPEEDGMIIPNDQLGSFTSGRTGRFNSFRKAMI
jgi:hypothetical protein